MSSSEKPRLTAGVGKARRWRSFPPGGARFPCAFGAAGETCKECLRLGAQTPRPPGGAGRYDFTWRAAALQTSDGWCGREARRRSVPGGTCRVSCPRLLNHSRFPDGRAHGFAAPLRVALPPSVATAHRADASLRACRGLGQSPKALCRSIFRERCERPKDARNAALSKTMGFSTVCILFLPRRGAYVTITKNFPDFFHFDAFLWAPASAVDSQALRGRVSLRVSPAALKARAGC